MIVSYSIEPDGKIRIADDYENKFLTKLKLKKSIISLTKKITSTYEKRFKHKAQLNCLSWALFMYRNKIIPLVSG